MNKQFPQLDTEFPQLLQDMIGDLTQFSGSRSRSSYFRKMPDLLQQWAQKVGTPLKPVPGVTDVKNGIENTISGPAVVFNVNQTIAARAGFTPQEIELDASAIFQGEPATVPVVKNSRSYTLRVRFPEDTRASLDPFAIRC